MVFSKSSSVPTQKSRDWALSKLSTAVFQAAKNIDWCLCWTDCTVPKRAGWNLQVQKHTLWKPNLKFFNKWSHEAIYWAVFSNFCRQGDPTVTSIFLLPFKIVFSTCTCHREPLILISHHHVTLTNLSILISDFPIFKYISGFWSNNSELHDKNHSVYACITQRGSI